MKIAFLFLTIDNVRFPGIWEYYFKNNNDKFNIYCHPKYPDKVTVSWQKKNIINNLAPTKWGFLTDATVNLLFSALQNKDNLKFILVSESCLPIKSFDLLYKFLNKDHINTSYIDFSNIDSNPFNFLKSKLPSNYFSYEIKKHSQWFCLSRYHTKKLLIHPDLKKFTKVIAGDENILTLISNENHIIDFPIIYVDWFSNKIVAEKIRLETIKLYEKKEKYKTNKYDKKIKKLREKRRLLGAHPKEYNKITKDVLQKIKKSESFFYRKFSVDSNIIKYYKEIL